MIAYLCIFRRRTFPLDHSRLLDLAHDRNDKLAREALAVLKHIEHSTVRALGLRLIRDSERMGDAVDLFIRNYQDGDFQIIESALSIGLDVDQYHLFGIGVLDIFEAHPTQDAMGVLTKLYEHGPCSRCREWFVDCLLAVNSLPDWMRKECQYDANLDLREKLALPTSQI